MKLTSRIFLVISMAVVFCGGGAVQAQYPQLTLVTDPEPVVGFSESAPIQVRFSGVDRPIEGAAISFTPQSDMADTYLSLLRDITDADGMAETLIEAGDEEVDFDILISVPDDDTVVPLTVRVRVLSNPDEPPAIVNYPSPEAPTLQAAVDLVADGGTVEVGPGVFRERLVIADKDVHIIGSGSGIGWRRGFRRTVLAAPRPRQLSPFYESDALIEFRSGGGSISNIALRGGDIGVELNAATQVVIENTKIRNVGYGVAGKATAIIVADSMITNVLGNAILILEAAAMDLFDNWIFDADQVGILVYNFESSGGVINIASQTLWFSGQGGIVVVGGLKPVYISDCQVNFSGITGLLLIATNLVEVLDTNIFAVTETSAPINYQSVADGLVAHNSSQVNIINSKFEYADRVGVMYSGSGGTVTGTATQNVRFGLASMNSPNLDFSDPNNNFNASEQSILTDGNLPVPEAPPLPEEP